MGQTVLVTGGTGFVASWCIAMLLERGYSVRATVRSLSKEAVLRAAVVRSPGAGERLTVAAADLTIDEGWDTATAGSDFVLHIASPLGAGAKGDFVGPARDGTLRVLKAATKAGVKRVVMTSAAAAARPPHRSRKASDETMWADPADPQFDAYRRSKILAERAAWDFADKNPSTELTTILPSAVFGPVLSKDNPGSVRIIQGLLSGRPSRIPRLGFWVVDVRDLAEAHIRAMTSPEAADQRFIVAGEFLWLAQIAQLLRDRLGPRAARVPTRRAPDFAVRLAALFNPQMRGLLKDLGRRNELTSARARRVLGFSPRPAAATVVECAESLMG